MHVISSLKDRDVLEKTYRKYLSRRLLCSGTVGIDRERDVVNKFKVAFGQKFVDKTETIIEDFLTSVKLCDNYVKVLFDGLRGY